MLRKVPFPVDLLRFVSGRTFHISSLSNAQVQVTPTFKMFTVRHLAFLKDLRYYPASVRGRDLARISLF